MQNLKHTTVVDIDQIIDGFRRGALDVDCVRIVISQRREGGARFEGPGYIRQGEDGALIFKLYVETKENAGPQVIFNILTGGAAGTIFRDDELYDLNATSVDGASWKANRIASLHPNWNMQDDTGVLNGHLHAIAAGSLLPSARPTLLRVHFFEEYPLPLQGLVCDRAEFDACGAHFTVKSRPGSGDTAVEASAETALPPAFGLRIQEALQYITGKSAIWRARVASCQGMFILELASPRPKAVRTQFNPPISPASIDFHQHTWVLFERFLTYLIRNTDASQDGYWNSVAYHLYNARESTSASADAWAIGVSVAVEAVTSVIELPDDRQKAEIWTNFRKSALKWLDEQQAFSEYVKQRARKLIENTGSKGTKQKLRELAEKGYVDKQYVDAWDRLRNRHVHPNLADLKLPGPREYRELFQRLWQVGTLLHQLTFYIIEYKGPFTDYGRAGCLSRPYPLSGQDDSVAGAH